MPRRPARIACALALPLVALPARADPPSADRAHTGFMFRGALGVGYAAVRGDDSALEVAGVAFSSHLAVGWYVVPNLAVHATLWNSLAFNPGGTSAGGATSVLRDNTPSATGRGLGLTWVFTPLDVFASASAGVSTVDIQATVADIVVVSRAAIGVACNVMVGRQWVGPSGWGFGVAAQGFFHRNSVTSRGAVEDVTSGGAALVGTLTYH